jgi:hypothetical protein
VSVRVSEWSVKVHVCKGLHVRTGGEHRTLREQVWNKGSQCGGSLPILDGDLGFFGEEVRRDTLQRVALSTGLPQASHVHRITAKAFAVDSVIVENMPIE